jgi:DNA invertase Pin-like site-specific DNA recombinase
MVTFAYGRVSTALQDTENQRLELASAGWAIGLLNCMDLTTHLHST